MQVILENERNSCLEELQHYLVSCDYKILLQQHVSNSVRLRYYWYWWVCKIPDTSAPRRVIMSRSPGGQKALISRGHVASSEKKQKKTLKMLYLYEIVNSSSLQVSFTESRAGFWSCSISLPKCRGWKCLQVSCISLNSK